MTRLGWRSIAQFATPIGPVTAIKQRHSTDIGGFEPSIPRDRCSNHLDKLNIEGDGMRLRHRRLAVIRRRDNQYTTISEWQFLRRRSPCVQAHAVPNATVKTPR